MTEKEILQINIEILEKSIEDLYNKRHTINNQITLNKFILKHKLMELRSLDESN